jgi:hypothetical protein
MPIKIQKEMTKNYLHHSIIYILSAVAYYCLFIFIYRSKLKTALNHKVNISIAIHRKE